MYYKSKIDYRGFTIGKLYKVHRVLNQTNYIFNDDNEEKTCLTKYILEYFDYILLPNIPNFYYKLKSAFI